MLNLRKTKKMDVLEDNNKKEYYGTGTDPKKDQKKYEKKVKGFLDYCKNFRNELVEESKNKDKEKGLKTVEDIKKCFDSSFKEYYKKSKKFSLFSRTTKVLKGMDKQLDKIGKDESITGKEIEEELKKAFKYTSKRDYEKDYGKRSAIDDKAVYGFFNATLPKIINNICQKARGEQADELKELNDLMDFVNESFGEVKRLSIKLGKGLESIKDEVKEQEGDVDEIQEKNKGLQQKAEESDGQKDKKIIDEMKAEIAVLEGKNKEHSNKIIELLGEYNDAKNLYIELLPFSNTNDKRWLNDEEKKKKLSMLLFGEENKSENVNLLLQGLDTKAGELKDKLEVMANEVKELKGDIEDNIKKIKKIKEEQKNMGNKLNAIK